MVTEICFFHSCMIFIKMWTLSLSKKNSTLIIIGIDTPFKCWHSVWSLTYQSCKNLSLKKTLSNMSFFTIYEFCQFICLGVPRKTKTVSYIIPASCYPLGLVCNRPFYSCVLCSLAFEWKRGWCWPCFERNLTAFLM